MEIELKEPDKINQKGDMSSVRIDFKDFKWGKKELEKKYKLVVKKHLTTLDKCRVSASSRRTFEDLEGRFIEQREVKHKKRKK